MTSTLSPAPTVRGSSAPRGQRLASTIRLPWLVGLGALLTLAVVMGLLAGRVGAHDGVQRAVLDTQRATAVGVAQQVRRSLNEGSDDLAQVAVVLAADITASGEKHTIPTEQAGAALRATAEWHRRYLSLALVDAGSGRPVLTVPGELPPAPMGALPIDRRLVAVLDDGRLIQSVPVRNGSDLLVAAVYDPAFLYPDLQPRPDAMYVIDRRGRAVAAPGAVGLTEPLPTAELRAAAADAVDRAGATARPLGSGLASVTAFAPVEGVGPAAEAGLGIVVLQEVATGPPATSYQISGALAALLLALATIGLFRWLHVSVMKPVLDLQRAAERVAYGDLSRPVAVRRFDDVGTAARALERIRLALIRAKIQDLDPHGEPDR